MRQTCIYRVAVIVVLTLLTASLDDACSFVFTDKKSAVTVDTVTVTENTGLGTWKVVVTGTFTLGTKDTFTGFSFSLTDPNAGTVAPTVTQYSQPAAGATTAFSYYTNTAEKGDWNANASFTFLTDQTPGIASG